MLGLAHFSLEECAEMYRRFGSEVFRQNRLVGTVKMGWSHSYYDTEIWEAILQYANNYIVVVNNTLTEKSNSRLTYTHCTNLNRQERD